jgi:hypothetical protein
MTVVQYFLQRNIDTFYLDLYTGTSSGTTEEGSNIITKNLS